MSYDPRDPRYLGRPMHHPLEDAMKEARRQFKNATATREQRIKATDMLTRTTEKWDADELIAAVEKMLDYWNRAEVLEIEEPTVQMQELPAAMQVEFPLRHRPTATVTRR